MSPHMASVTCLERGLAFAMTAFWVGIPLAWRMASSSWYRAMISPIKLGLTHVTYIELKLSDTRETALKAFNAAVSAIPEVEECYMIAGGFDYLVKIRARDMADYRRIMSEDLSTLPHVHSSSSYVAMETVVEASAPPLE